MDTHLIIFLIIFLAIPAVPVVVHFSRGRNRAGVTPWAGAHDDAASVHSASAEGAQRQQGQAREYERQAALSQFAASNQSDPLHAYWASTAFKPPGQ